MSFVVINVLTVPESMRATLEDRFANRAGEVDAMDGFEHFELLRPVEGQDNYLVYTRWSAREHFETWMNSRAFSQGHAKTNTDGPAATGSQVWSFEVAQSKSKAAGGAQ